MKKLLLGLALLISISSFATESYKIISIQDTQGVISFKKCVNDYCQTLGDKEGYSKERLKYHPNFRIIGNSIALVSEGAALLLSGIATAAVPFLGWVVVGGVLTWINNGDTDGPIDGIQKANLARKLNNVKSSNQKETVILLTENDYDYIEVVNMMNDLLIEI